MGKLATFASMPPAERRAVLEAIGEVLRAQIVVALVPLRHWSDEIAPAQAARVDAESIRLVRIAVARAAANLSWLAPKCLPLALAARRMLARRGVSAQLHIGTAFAPEAGDDRFHAWLKAGGAFVTGDCDESRYARFARPAESDVHTNA